jgi:hypothetical protein
MVQDMRRLEDATRRIAEGQARIERQRRLVDGLRRHDERAGLQVALDLLMEFERTQQIALADWKRIEAELGKSRV